jgi:hypothetical protein
MRADLEAALDVAERGDADAGYRLLKPWADSPELQTLSPVERHTLLRLFGLVAHDTDHWADGLAALRRSSEMDGADADDWYFRLLCAGRLTDTDDMERDLTVLARNYAERLADVDDDAIVWVLHQTPKSPEAKNRRFELVDALAAANWAPHQPDWVDYAWRDHAAALLERGQQARAQALASRITSGVILASMRVDRRFDPLVRADPARYEVGPAFERALASARARSTLEPRNLADVNEVAGLLLQLNRPGEALALADDALARALPASGPSAFDDPGEINWTMNRRASALLALGRTDEAVAELVRAMRRPERGELNISQAINLAQMQCAAGRPADALQTLADVSPRGVSPYGLMNIEYARACALSRTGDRAGLERSLAFMREHRGDGLKLLFLALLRANDLDGAASEIVARLDAPDERLDALLDLQDYALTTQASDWDRELAGRVAALRARPEVKAAIARWGRVEALPIRRPAV